MQLSVEVAAGVGVQMMLFVTPALCFSGWAIGQRLDLSLELLHVVLLIFSNWVLACIVASGQNNYVVGCMSVAL